MNETRLKTILRTIILKTAENSTDHVEFITAITYDYGITEKELIELGFEYVLESRYGSAERVYLYPSIDEAIDKLKNLFDTFRITNSPVDVYIREDDMYAYIDTTDDDYSFRAEVIPIGKEKTNV